jgi:hypothetical protein
MAATIHQILLHLFPDRPWTMYGDEIIPRDGGPIPTPEEIEAARPAAEAAIAAEAAAAATALAARKVWPTVSEFWAEFENGEKYAIETSPSPEIIVLRADLKLWLKDVWSDDPRIVLGLDTLVAAGIIDEARRVTILTKQVHSH